jgi:cysteinyl-tRNA synthetase
MRLRLTHPVCAMIHILVLRVILNISLTYRSLLMNLHVRLQPLIKPSHLSRTTFRMTSTSARQPPWTQPQGATKHPGLKVYNSLTRSKVPFVPQDKNGKLVTWYVCGPTVYDDSHLGHARNYVSTDILRRLLKDYFGFDVRFVMNITDVDDKIILRGRQRHLYDEYKSQHRYIQKEVREDVAAAWQAYVRKYLPKIRDPAPSPRDFRAECSKAYASILAPAAKVDDADAKTKMHIQTAGNTAKALSADPKELTPTAFYELTNDVMCFALDAKSGSTIKGDDHAIFLKLTQEYERRFFQDMRDLNVMDPDELVRVTEHGKQIAEFVDRIVQNHFAYSTSDGSVYFDIAAFEAAGRHYARLEPWNRTDKSLQADGEGALSQKTTEKRSDADFALWKASKPGEPSWPSPWGPGRPGWHIECSAMASARLGSQMDIHSGGIDLAFPHHDNELAQSEAFWHDGRQWVNYFLHMGHLSIQGSKMSKSLKNFTTIRTALDRKDWTSRSLRIVFLLGSWRDGIEITDDLVKEGAGWEDRVDNFFINAIEEIRTTDPALPTTDKTLQSELENTKQKVYDALCDSFDTSKAMAAISTLITTYNSAKKAKAQLSKADIESTALYITKIVNTFGLNGTASPDPKPRDIGWQGIEIPAAAKEFVMPLSRMRDELRQAAINKNISPQLVDGIVSSYPQFPETPSPGRPRPSFARVLSDFRAQAIAAVSSPSTANGVTNGEASQDASKEILALCDRVRDVDLWSLNVYLEDRENAPALVRPVTSGLRNARKEKEERLRMKEEAKKKRDQAEREKLEKGRLDPTEMFRPPHCGEYAEWDDEGFPVRMANGDRVSDNRMKKLRKDWDRQRRAHEVWLAAMGAQNGVVGGSNGGV